MFYTKSVVLLSSVEVRVESTSLPYLLSLITSGVNIAIILIILIDYREAGVCLCNVVSFLSSCVE